MKVSVIQPYYSMKYEDMETCFQGMLGLMDACDESMDIIVLPEYCDIPAATPNGEAFHQAVEKYNAVVAEKASALAKRCHAIVFANFAYEGRNTTHAFDREGNVVGRYYKTHPAPSEVKTLAEGGNGMEVGYSYHYEEPYVLELEGLRSGFMTCYDFYMYEAFAAIARKNVDIIIGCSHQRTDTHLALDIIGQFLSYQTNSYLIRSAVSLGEESEICGCSMVVSPKGDLLLDMKSKLGVGPCAIDPSVKYEKPAGFRGKPKPHHEYIDEGRRPWLYRPAGSMMLPSEKHLGYPRICAHRGFSTIAPENSMPAFGAAVALGAEEIEFDLWATKDGELVSIHDANLDRVSDGHGYVWDYTFEELQQFDFGYKTGEAFRGLKIIRFEDILKKFACTTIMNIHVKTWDTDPEDPQYERIASLIRKYDAQNHVYIMNSNDRCQAEFHEIAPDIPRCVGWNGVTDKPLEIVERAIRLGCEKVQLFKPYFNQEAVDLAHENGILCNVFFADDPDEACRYIDMGIDTILTNDYLRVSNAVRAHIKK
ncbi:MAG: hypothetical protein MJ141_00260 [Clostridia bacterium]|nr:hypothetical protein [Clostridia bacterium]